jgi:hypothetical protein
MLLLSLSTSVGQGIFDFVNNHWIQFFFNNISELNFLVTKDPFAPQTFFFS